MKGRSKKAAKAAKAAKAKLPTLAELEENERKHRDYLESSAEHYAYAISLPDNLDDEEECHSAEYDVEEAIE